MDYKKQTIKELEKYYRLKTRTIPNLKNRIELKEYELEGVGALEYSDMPGPTGGKKLSYRREKLLDEKKKLEERLKINEAFVTYINEALEKLNDTDRNILIECYSKDKYEKLSEQKICEKLNISSPTLYRRKREIIKEFSEDLFGI